VVEREGGREERKRLCVCVCERERERGWENRKEKKNKEDFVVLPCIIS
jgi:hypothetical protein